jgi:tryptophan synthase alpha chain
MIARICRYTTLPIAVGFGVSRPEHVREISEYADAVVVGSAIVRRIGGGDSVVEIGRFVEELLAPLKGTRS